MSASPPKGLAKFDSAAAMVTAVARFLEGRDFTGFGEPWLYRALVRHADRVPRRLRKSLFARAGASEGVAPDNAGEVDTEAIAAWAAASHPDRRYPAVVLGSSSGALVHLAAALGVPWLPQTFLTLLKQRVHPDEPAEAMEAAREPGRKFLAANPGVQLHHMHDPSQDRLMLRHIGYFRWKYRSLPRAYRDFLIRSLEPGGTVILAECIRHWPTTRVGDRHLFQMGAVGGPTRDEYFRGGPRVSDFLERHSSHRRRWEPPHPDGESPEAEWGFEPALREEVVALARERGYRVLRLRFDDPDDLSPVVADLYRAWNQVRGIAASRLLIESFILVSPYWALRTGSVPFWMVFNMQPSLDRVQQYLSTREHFEEVRLMLFAHGVDSIGLPEIAEWRALLSRARRHGTFLGLDEDAYPAHFAAFARYNDKLRKLSPRYDLPQPLPLEHVSRQLSKSEHAGVHLIQDA